MSITLILCILIGFVSYQALQNGDTMFKLLHYPYQEERQKEYYRWLTACFVHGDYMHLFINLFVFYQFGESVEYRFNIEFGETLGRIYFLILFIGSGVFANLLTYLKQKDNHQFRSVGASGAVSGILLAFVIFDPWSWLLLFFIIPIPAFIAAVLYLFYSSWAAKKQMGSRIDHEAHFWGAVFGFAFTIIIKPSLFTEFIALLMQPDFSF